MVAIEVAPIGSRSLQTDSYKFNEARRHKIPKAKYKVTNWPDYDAALVRRGSLTVWLTEEAIADGMRREPLSVAVSQFIPI